MIFLAALLLDATEGFLADMAVILSLHPSLHKVALLQPLLVLVELHDLGRERLHVLEEPKEAPVPTSVLKSSL